MKRKRSGIRGYILLEIMIAVTILSLAIVGLATSLGDMIKFYNMAQREAILREKLQTQLAIARGLQDLEQGTVTTEPDADQIQFVREIERMEYKTKDEEDVRGIYRVHISGVWPNTTGEDAKAEAEIFLYRN